MDSRENVILIGFMGTGKTAVGKRVASRLGRRFVDTDDLIEERAGRSIPRIFAEDGEPGFRRLEAEVIAQAVAGDGRVIATGGGAVLSRANMTCLRRSGVIVALRADAESILARVGRAEYRPLLGDAPEENIRRLLRERERLGIAGQEQAECAVVERIDQADQAAAEQEVVIFSRQVGLRVGI